MNDEMVKRRIERTLIIPDIHVPHEDYRALKVIKDLAKKEQFEQVKILGDLVDFYALSNFDKDPERITGLQQEIDVARYHLQELRSALPKADITMYEGNHEFRLLRYLKQNPAMSSLEVVNNVPSILGLKDFDIKYKKNEDVHSLLGKHGNVVRGHSSYTAKGEFDREGTSGFSGHTHRMGAHYITNRSGQHAWFEMGHLCNEDGADYMEGRVANWQKGFGILHYDTKLNTWKMEQIPINKNSFIYNDQVYAWRSNMKVAERDTITESK